MSNSTPDKQSSAKDSAVISPGSETRNSANIPSKQTTPLKSPNAEGFMRSAGSQRVPFSRQGSGVTSTPSRSRLDRQLSHDNTARRRRASCRRGSSFDLPHSNSLVTAPVDLTVLSAIDRKAVPWWTSQRFILSIVCFFGFCLLYAQRVNLSIAIVSMVDHTSAHPSPTNSTTTIFTTTTYNGSGLLYTANASDGVTASRLGAGERGWSSTPNGLLEGEGGQSCPEMEETAKRGEFSWSKPLQGLILGAFFWGYLILQVVGGVFSERFGAKKVITMGMLPVAIFTLLTPLCARADPYLFLVVRIFTGIGEGVMYPAAQALWARWAPPTERSRLIGFSYAGGQFGNAMIFPIGGYLCAFGFDGGWPSVFYVIGTCGVLWCIVWVILASDSPDQCKRISAIEKKYIQLSVGHWSRKTKGHGSTPWRAIFSSGGMWAIIVAHTCGNYGAYMMLTQIPTYMKEVLKFDIKSNGVFSMLPYLCFWFFITVSGMLADFLIARDVLSVARTRKLMACIGMVGPGSFLIGTGFMSCQQQTEAVIMLTLGVGLCGFHFSGYFINHGDIAPAYAGTLFGISNTAATVPGILAPYVVSALTPNGEQAEWQTAFYVAAAIYFFGAAFYVVLGQGEVQPWAEQEESGDMAEQGEAGTGFDLHEIQEMHEEEDHGDDNDADGIDAEEKAALKITQDMGIDLPSRKRAAC